jgi:hypothetical protein
VNAIVSISAVEYRGYQTVHALLSFGIDDQQKACFTSHPLGSAHRDR